MDRRKLTAFGAAAALAFAALAGATAANALDDCPAQPRGHAIHTASGIFESVAFDPRGRLFFTNSTAGELLMIRRSGAKPKVVLDGIDAPAASSSAATATSSSASVTASPREATGRRTRKPA